MSLAVYITITVIIIILMGLSAGTFFGLLSVDELDMEVSLISGDQKRKTEARKILQVIAKHHLLLVTLLIVNDSCMEILPIMLPEAIQDLDEIEISILCFVIIFIFGEIVPLAMFSGSNQIKIASKIVPLVKIWMVMFYPIAKPIAMLLDCCLKGGHKQKRYTVEQLKALIGIHTQKAEENVNKYKESIQLTASQAEMSEELKTFNEPLLFQEALLIQKALEIRQTKIEKIIIPLDLVFMLDYNSVLDQTIMEQIVSRKY